MTSVYKLQKQLQDGFGNYKDYINMSYDELVNELHNTRHEREKILGESAFNTYHQNPKYAETFIIETLVNKILREIRPKRTKKKKRKRKSDA